MERVDVARLPGLVSVTIAPSVVEDLVLAELVQMGP